MRKPFRFIFALLCWEGALAMAYETLVGPTYLSGLAGELGQSVALVSVLTALPWVGSSSQLAGTWIFERVASRKRYSVWIAGLARALWMLPLFWAVYWGRRSWVGGGSFPSKAWFNWVAVVACSSAVLGSSSSVTWMSWMKDLIPARFQGRFWGVRSRYVMLALVGANLLAATWVGWKPSGYLVGYAVIGFIALLSAGASTVLLAQVDDAKNLKSLKNPGSLLLHRPLKEVLCEPFNDPIFRPVLICGAAFNGAMQLAGPFFPYYFTRELGIPMAQIATWLILSNLGCFLAAGLWGKRIDRQGDSRPTLWICGNLMALSPLAYLFQSKDAVEWVGPLEYLTNGIYSVGFAVALNAMLFASCPRGKNSAYFSVFAAANGIAGATGTLLGGFLAQRLAPWGGFRTLWILGAAARVGVIWVIWRSLLWGKQGRKPLPTVSPA